MQGHIGVTLLTERKMVMGCSNMGAMPLYAVCDQFSQTRPLHLSVLCKKKKMTCASSAGPYSDAMVPTNPSDSWLPKRLADSRVKLLGSARTGQLSAYRYRHKVTE